MKTPIITSVLIVIGTAGCVDVSKKESMTPGEVALAYELSKHGDAEEEYGAAKYLIPSAREAYTELVKLRRVDPDRYSVLSPISDPQRFELRILSETVEGDSAQACVRDVCRDEFGPRGDTYRLTRVDGTWFISHRFKIDFDDPPGKWLDIGACFEGWLETSRAALEKAPPNPHAESLKRTNNLR